MLTLCLLSAGLALFGTSPFVHEIVLLAVAVFDAPLRLRRLRFVQ